MDVARQEAGHQNGNDEQGKHARPLGVEELPGVDDFCRQPAGTLELG